MPAYNAEAFISQALDSVVFQTHEDWELLVTNDGSTDATETILKSYTDPRIKPRLQPNRGVSAARNAALSRAKGDYITFLDADDVLPRDSLKIRVDRLTGAGQELVIGAVARFTETPSRPTSTWQPSLPQDALSAYVRLDDRIFCNPSFLLPRLGAGRFDETMTHCEDLDFIINYCRRNAPRIHLVQSPVYSYRVWGDSAMSNLSKLEAGYWQLYRKVEAMEEVAQEDKVYLRHRIVRIMLFSYVRKRDFLSAARVLWRSLLPPDQA